jgi:hypothetical protein
MVFDCGRMQQSVCNLVAFIPFILEQISCKRLLAETFHVSPSIPKSGKMQVR